MLSLIYLMGFSFAKIDILICLSFCHSAFASETDNFSGRATAVDQTKSLDEKFNSAMTEIANETQSCEVSELHDGILGKLGGWGRSAIEDWITFDDGKPKHSVEDNALYSNLPDSSEVFPLVCCSPIAKVNGVIIGSDKIGHFLQSGFEMYRYAQKNGVGADIADSRSLYSRMYDRFNREMNGYEAAKTSSIVSQISSNPTLDTNLKLDLLAAEYGTYQEDTGWGAKWGIKSYADIAANIDGMHFWINLTSGNNPYFICKNNKWHFNREFKWEDYVSDAWDEAINCNDYTFPNQRRAIQQKIKVITKNESAACPLDPSKCGGLIKRYGQVASKILHEDCFRAGTRMQNSSTSFKGI